MTLAAEGGVHSGHSRSHVPALGPAGYPPSGSAGYPPSGSAGYPPSGSGARGAWSGGKAVLEGIVGDLVRG